MRDDGSVAQVMTATNAFPVTAFGADGAFDAEVFRRVLTLISKGSPGAVFTGCGTGEFWSLAMDERIAAAEVALEVLGRKVPVYVGWGGSDPASRAALGRLRDRGVAGVLLMAPEPWPWDADGIVSYWRMTVEEAGLPVIVYLKSHGNLDPSWWAETVNDAGVAGLKDGIGDQDFLMGLLAAGLEPDRVINGTPTAEWLAPAYWAVGVRGYSSAVMNFAPAIARSFRDALEAGRHAEVRRLLFEFYARLRTVRARSASYAVSMVKAGVQSRGIPVGRVRPPLGWPDKATLRQINELVAVADALTVKQETMTGRG